MHQIRNRILTIRVSDDEFEQLKTTAELRGSRCLSDFARSIMLETASRGSASLGTWEGRMLSFERRLSALESGLGILHSALSTHAQRLPPQGRRSNGAISTDLDE